MRASALEILAGILIVLAVVKLAVVLVNTRAWIALARALYTRPMVTSTVSIVLAGVVLYFLLTSGLTIVQILAVALFVLLLIVPGFAPYASVLLGWLENKDIGQIVKAQWLYVAIWLILLGWGVYELVFV